MPDNGKPTVGPARVPVPMEFAGVPLDAVATATARIAEEFPDLTRHLYTAQRLVQVMPGSALLLLPRPVKRTETGIALPDGAAMQRSSYAALVEIEAAKSDAAILRQFRPGSIVTFVWEAFEPLVIPSIREAEYGVVDIRDLRAVLLLESAVLRYRLEHLDEGMDHGTGEPS